MKISIRQQQDLFFLRSALDLMVVASPRSRIGDIAHLDVQRACVLGTVMCSVSFLECSISGLYHYAQNSWRNTKFHCALASVWSEGFDRQPLLSKYQIALALAKRETFQIDAEPYQSASTLVELRNAIAHPKELIESDLRGKKLEKRLQGKYAFNVQDEYHDDFLPDRCLSFHCALWAVETAADFFLEFRKRIPATAYPVSFETTIKQWLTEVQELRSV